MPLATERALRIAIRDRSFEPVYLFFGADDFQKDQTARELASTAVDASTRDFNSDTIRGSEISADVLDTILNTPPMMAPRRVVTIRDANGLTRPARAALDQYLEHPAVDTVLILTVPANEKAEAALVTRTCAVEFAPLSAERVPRWIVHYAGTAFGTEITPAAAALLHRAIGADLGHLAGELDKLASYTSGAPITEDAVTSVVGVRPGESVGDLLDAVAERDARRAASLVAPVLGQPKVSLVNIVMALTTQTLAIGWGARARSGGRGGALERDYYGLLRESRAYPGRAWSEAVKTWSRGVSRWSSADVDEALDLLLAADRAAKETRYSSEEQLLTWLVLALCATGERAAA